MLQGSYVGQPQNWYVRVKREREGQEKREGGRESERARVREREGGREGGWEEEGGRKKTPDTSMNDISKEI